MNPIIESAHMGDAPAVLQLCQDVAAVEGSLARAADEFSPEYVHDLMVRSLESGVVLVARTANDSSLAGMVHACVLSPRAFGHVLGELTIAVHPRSQGRGIGRALIGALVDVVVNTLPHVRRIELIARESNTKAISIYEDFGFRVEGRLEGRISAGNDQYEADVPMAWTRQSGRCAADIRSASCVRASTHVALPGSSRSCFWVSPPTVFMSWSMAAAQSSHYGSVWRRG